jgi:hypothetical protein
MADSKTLTNLIEVLESLTPDDRRRNINAALTFLGDPSLPQLSAGRHLDATPADTSGYNHFPTEVAGRMKQYNISAEDAVHVFEFRDGEPFKVLAVPGKGKKPQTLAMYHLVGLGTFLETGKREFADATARKYCKDYGCYDPPNHATYLDEKHPAFTGDKNSGWLLTVPGIKVAVGIIKEVSEAAAQ